MKFLLFEKYGIIQRIIDKSKDIIEVFNNLDKLKKAIDKYNPKFNYKVSKNVIDKFKLEMKNYIENPKRVHLIADFIFDYKDKNINFEDYDFDKFNYELVKNFEFRGLKPSKNETDTKPIKRVVIKIEFEY